MRSPGCGPAAPVGNRVRLAVSFLACPFPSHIRDTEQVAHYYTHMSIYALVSRTSQGRIRTEVSSGDQAGQRADDISKGKDEYHS